MPEVQKRLEKHGTNELPREKAPGALVIFLRQFVSPLILVLVAAMIVTLFLHEFVDAAVIGAAVVVNTIIGFFQEYKANKSLEKLRSLVQPKASVIRGGKEQLIKASAVVPGDIVILSAGDRVAADMRILEATDLEIDEASLTGESLPISKQTAPTAKHTDLADRVAMAYAGTAVAAGRGIGVVTATGIKTEIGRIAQMVQNQEEGDTPLQDELGRLAKWISFVVVFLVVALFAVGIWRGQDVVEMFETSIALAVAAVPEGLIIAITVILALGAQKMYKRKSLVRRLVAAETLGSVSVICADKTGTITEGKMQVTEIVPLSGSVKAEGISYVDSAEEIVYLLEIGMLCNDASVSIGTSLEKTEVNGSPTERALMQSGLNAGIRLKALRKRHKRIDEIPFDSGKKWMATLNGWDDGSRILVKGAPERVKGFCGSVSVNGEEKALTQKKQKELSALSDAMTRRGLRVLAIAEKRASARKSGIEASDMKEMTFLGFVGLKDPLRKAAPEQIERARAAGVRTIIITGDHPNTARAIAKEAGMNLKASQVIKGSVMEKWDDKTLRKRVKDAVIFARAEPKHKIRIVKALQANGEVVAMTGDGVNDAPALKAADVGIALGSGTEVAKGTADIVLLNDDLATITAAIEEGRVMFDNIRKATVNLMIDSFTEMVLIGGALIFGLPLPLIATQILWINLFADSLPSIALTTEPGEPDIMKVPPRKRKEPVLNREMLTYIFGIGLMTDLVLFPLYLWYLHATGDPDLARTVIFAAVGIDSLIYVFALKSFRRSLFRINPFSNLWLVGAILVGYFLMGLALLHPFFQSVFQVVPLSLSDFGILLMMAFIKLFAIEVTKEWFNYRRKHYAKA